MNIESIQGEIQKAGLDGWLFVEEHGARVTGEMQTELVRFF